MLWCYRFFYIFIFFLPSTTNYECFILERIVETFFFFIGTVFIVLKIGSRFSKVNVQQLIRI